MKTANFLALTASLAALAVLPALAGDGASGKPALTGKDAALQKIDAANARQMEILTRLLSKVPAEAQATIQNAIDAARQGRDVAVAALSEHGAPSDIASADDTTERAAEQPAEDTEGSGEAMQPEVTGLERARAAVAAGFEKGQAKLQGLLDRVPDRAASRIQAALDRLDTTRAVALRNLDGLIAGERPDHPMAQEIADRPERPSRPDRPDRPDLPERPQPPERPERPSTPDHPAPTHG
ncbi:MAG TPA: hypothetical protein VNL37_00115 [Candidatus Polarisedimenticolia bacterium]|nr:hypothetical protein [Candidatus Polarisedimenticolia bacterium]